MTDAPPPLGRGPGPAAADLAAETIRLLVVDDNPDDRRLVRRALEREFDAIRIREAANPKQLAAALEAGDFDVVVTDYGLRWSDGLTVLREIRSRHPDRPVIMFTGTGNQEIAVEAMKAGLTDYVVKTPKQFGQLPYVVRSAIEQRRQRLALEEMQRRYRDIVDLVPAVIEMTALDEPATPLFVSPHIERQLGWTVQEWLADPGLWLASIHPDDQRAVVDAHERQRQSHAPFVAEYRMRRRDGTWAWIHDEAVVVGGRDQPVSFGVRFDVTDRHRLEEDLRQAQKMEALGRLAGGVAHDFNNLLTVIAGHAQLLELELPGDAGREDVDAIRGAAERATSLTRQLLSFSRRQPLRPERLDVRSVVDGMATLLRRLIKPDVEIVVEVPDRPVQVVVDKTQLEQILINLAVNAADAMPDGGRFVVSVATDGDQAVILASDSGTGMTEEVMARVFEPFFTTKAEGQGTGLGLATVFGAVEGAGGSVDVRSAVGEGATFEIRLPLAVDRRQLPREADAARRSRRASSAREVSASPAAEMITVLVIDDDPQVRAVATRMLELAGYAVLQADGGEQALGIVFDPAIRLDVVLTDVMMPGMLGSDVAKSIGRIRPEIPVLVMSGFADGAVIDSIDAPILPKPFTADELVRAVRKATGDGPPPEAPRTPAQT